MNAVVFAIVFFVVLTLVGFGPIAWLRTNDDAKPRDVLLAPAVGAALIAIFTVLFNRLGAPVASFAVPMCVVLSLIGIVGLIRNGKRFALKASWPFAPILVFALVISGWPLFSLGYSWVSFANDDMANYSLSAQRLVDRPFYEPPNQSDFIRNSHISQYLWVFENVINERYGVDEILAVATKLAGRSPLETFMPLMVSLQLALVAAAAALAWRENQARLAAIVTGILVSASSLLTMGLDLQLIAQSAGLAVLAAGIIYVAELPLGKGTKLIPTLRFGALTAIVLSGLGEIYPELLPFLVAPAIGFFVLRALRRKINLVPMFGWAGGLIVSMAVLLNGYLVNFATVLIYRSGSAGSGVRFVESVNHKKLELSFLFPYYLLPTGFANYFGIYPLTVYPADPVLSGGIIVGMLATILIAYATFREILRESPVAFVNAFAGLLACWLFYKEADFGLYKLAMYSQPFMIATVSLWWTGLWMKYGAPKLSATAQMAAA